MLPIESEKIITSTNPACFREFIYAIEGVVGYNNINYTMDIIKRYYLVPFLNLEPITIGALTFQLNDDGSIKVTTTPEYKKALQSEEDRKIFVVDYYKNKLIAFLKEDPSKEPDGVNDFGLAKILYGYFDPVTARLAVFRLVEFVELSLLNSYIESDIFRIFNDNGKIIVEFKEANKYRLASKDRREDLISKVLASFDTHSSNIEELKRLWVEFFKK